MSACNYIRTPSLTDIQRDSVSFDLRVAILKGLTSEPKALPSLLLWDDKGLARFEAVRIAESVDYYPSRKEIEVIEKDADDIARSIPTGTALIELGSGNTEKATRILSALQRQGKPITYYGLDVSSVDLVSSLDILSQNFPPSSGIQCHGLLGTYDDFLAWLAQKPKQLTSSVIFLWLRNSIGNLSAREASSFLARFVSSNAINHLQFIIGIDGCQNQSQIERCYDPTNPVTRDFLMNGLDQANKVLETSVFREGDWTCMGFFDPTDNVWKSYYVARRNVELNFAEPSIHIAKGERIFAISSAKWTQRQIEKISSGAGFWMAKAWKDEDSVYGLYLLRQTPADSGEL